MRQYIVKRVYIDTSVVGGRFDEEFKKSTILFWEAIFNGQMIVIVSDLLEEELKNAPEPVRLFFKSIPESSIEKIKTTPESEALAREYIARKVIGQSSISDCLHIAMATLCRADVLVSWNFKHIVNISRIKGYHSVNMMFGYSLLEIRTPSEVQYANTEY